MSEFAKSLKIRDQFPQFFDFEESMLSTFIQYYYEWMESHQGPDYYSRRMLKYNDIDFTEDGYEKFDQFLKNEFMADIPTKLQVDDRLLLKNIQDFYKAKGTEAAVKLLFRILYNEDVEFEYPGKYMLRVSDGRWLIETSLFVVLLTDGVEDISPYDFLIGVQSGASGKVQRIEQRLENSVMVTEIFITNVFGTFTPGEILKSKLTNREVAIVTTEGMKTYPGKYTSTDGFLSWDRKIQDSHYYQEYSYVIKSARDTNEYSAVLKNLAHPAGTLFFGEYNLRIYLDNTLNESAFDKMFSKQISYTIPLQDFIQLSLESNVTQGSFSGKYIIEYYLTTLEFDNFITNQVVDTGIASTTAVTPAKFTVTGLTFKTGDILEIYEPVNKITVYRRVRQKLSDTELLVYKPWPFLERTNLQVKLYQPENMAENSVEYEHYVNNYLMGGEPARVSDFNLLSDVRDVQIKEIPADLTIADITEKRYLVRKEHNDQVDFASEPVARGTIARVKNNLNSKESYFFVQRLIGPTVVQLRDLYKDGTSTDITYELINH